MKIMVVLSSFSGGGAERVATLWCGAFVELGHDVLFASNIDMNDAPFVYPIDKRVKIVKCFGFYNKPHKGWSQFMSHYIKFLYNITRNAQRFIKSNFVLRQTMKNFQPDIILSIIQPTSIRVLIASWGLHYPIITTEHNSFERPASAPMSSRDKFYKFTANKWFKAVTVLTEADKKFIGDRLKNVYVMPNPLAFEPITEGGG